MFEREGEKREEEEEGQDVAVTGRQVFQQVDDARRGVVRHRSAIDAYA